MQPILVALPRCIVRTALARRLTLLTMLPDRVCFPFGQCRTRVPSLVLPRIDSPLIFFKLYYIRRTIVPRRIVSFLTTTKRLSLFSRRTLSFLSDISTRGQNFARNSSFSLTTTHPRASWRFAITSNPLQLRSSHIVPNCTHLGLTYCATRGSLTPTVIA